MLETNIGRNGLFKRLFKVKVRKINLYYLVILLQSVRRLISAASNASGLCRWEEFSFYRWLDGRRLLCWFLRTCRDPAAVHGRSGAGGNLSPRGSG